MKHRFTAALERFSRAMLAPLTYLSAAGLLLAAGALLLSLIHISEPTRPY